MAMMTDRQRLVLSCSPYALDGKKLVGMRVVGAISSSPPEIDKLSDGINATTQTASVGRDDSKSYIHRELELHDALYWIVGFTTLRCADSLLPLVCSAADGRAKGAEWRESAVSAIEAWLKDHPRLIERSTGRPMLRAHFVQIDCHNVVVS